MKTNYFLKNVFASSIVACGLLFSHADAQIVGGINYNIINGNAVEVAPLPKNGDLDVRYSQANIVIPATVKIGETTYPVKRIGNNSMRENPNLVSVTIPEGVEAIGNSAFAQCSLLPSVVLPASVKSIEDWAFYGCPVLESINIPDGVPAITEHTFQQSGLKSITLPASVKTLKVCAFQDAKLTSINLENVTSIGAWSLSGTLISSVNIANVFSILSCAFNNCPNLETVKLTDVNTVGEWAFQTCVKLKNVDLGKSLESIDGGAFSGCKELKSLVIPNSVLYIGNWALEKTGLTEVYISWDDFDDPDKQPFIEENAFGKDEGKSNITWKVPAELSDLYGNTWNGFPVAVGKPSSMGTGLKVNSAIDNPAAYFSNGVLSLNNLSGNKASVFTALGSKVAEILINNPSEQISINLPAGIYILITNNNTSAKFIVK